LLCFSVFGGNFPSTSPRGVYIWGGDLTEGLLRYRFGGLIFGGLIHGGAYFRNFTVIDNQPEVIEIIYNVALPTQSKALWELEADVGVFVIAKMSTGWRENHNPRSLG